MSRNQQCRMMPVLVGIVLMSMFISNYNVEAYSRRNHKTDYSSAKRLHQLIRQLEMNDDDELFFDTRAEQEGDCTANILEEYQWNGKQTMSKWGIDTAQRCMDSCDANDKCMGWSYKPDSKMCWGLARINGVIPAPGVKSGSCVGTNLKVKCTENLQGQYPGGGKETIENIATVEDCMTTCDNRNTCFGWLYSPDDKKCHVMSRVGSFQADDYFRTGSCLAQQKRVRLADPLKIFRQEMLERHNEKRKAHCVSDLQLDSDLSKAAQEFAEKLAAADVTPPGAEEDSSLQAVYFNKGDDARHGTAIVDSFYGEYKYFDYDKPDFLLGRHFIRIIWKGSTKMGVGRAFTSDKQSMFVVTKYDWSGNVADSYKDNVQKTCSK